MDYLELRKNFGDPWVFGTTIEIGAGLRPVNHELVEELFIADKRQGAEFEEYFGAKSPAPIINIDDVFSKFPAGVDSITGHHVIEHLSDPISTLSEWFKLLKNGGIFYFSIPSPHNTSEIGRLITPFQHVLEDFCFERGEDSYESKQHIYSFCLACTASEGELTPWYAVNSTADFSRFILQDSKNRDDHDLHWHTYNLEAIRDVVFAAGYFAGIKVVIEAEYESEDSIYIVLRRLLGEPVVTDSISKFRDNLLNILKFFKHPN